MFCEKDASRLKERNLGATAKLKRKSHIFLIILSKFQPAKWGAPTWRPGVPRNDRTFHNVSKIYNWNGVKRRKLPERLVLMTKLGFPKYLNNASTRPGNHDLTKSAFLLFFLVKLCVDRLVCDKYKMLCDDVHIDSNQQVKDFLKEKCPNTCGYCSKLILDITACISYNINYTFWPGHSNER